MNIHFDLSYLNILIVFFKYFIRYQQQNLPALLKISYNNFNNHQSDLRYQVKTIELSIH